jgi:guanine nucleotide-binding protein subunit alpha
MRLIHSVEFTPTEIEFYRHLVFSNLTYGMKCVLDAADELELQPSSEVADAIALIEESPDIKDHQPYPSEYHEALQRLWDDETVQAAVKKGNEFALPDKSVPMS